MSEENTPPPPLENPPALDDSPALPEDVQAEYREKHSRRSLEQGYLTPRHRRLCQLAASGVSLKQIASDMGFNPAYVSQLLAKEAIRDEVARLQDRIFEESVQQRLKSQLDSALNHIEFVMTDRTNRVSMEHKSEISKWLIEKVDGKATQKHDIGENMLSVVMDRLDDMKKTGKTVDDLQDVTPLLIEVATRPLPTQATPEPAKTTPVEDLDWVDDFKT